MLSAIRFVCTVGAGRHDNAEPATIYKSRHLNPDPVVTLMQTLFRTARTVLASPLPFPLAAFVAKPRLDLRRGALATRGAQADGFFRNVAIEVNLSRDMSAPVWALRLGPTAKASSRAAASRCIASSTIA